MPVTYTPALRRPFRCPSEPICRALDGAGTCAVSVPKQLGMKNLHYPSAGAPTTLTDMIYVNFFDLFENNFKIHELVGTVDDTTPALTWDTAKEYYEFTVTFTPAASRTVMEIDVPDGYMGMDIWEGATLKTGDAHYTLSVPYTYDAAGAPAKDWQALALESGSGAAGIKRRVQVASDNAGATALTVRVYYATAPAVGFDGVNDCVYKNGITTTGLLEWNITVKNIEAHDGKDVLNLAFWLNQGVLLETYSGRLRLYYINSSGTSVNQILNAYGWNTTSYSILEKAATLDIYENGVLKFQKAVDCGSSPTRIVVGADNLAGTNFWQGIFYTLNFSFALYDASSFSGGASTTVTDFSGSGNHGTAYGGVQYKVYTGTGFQFTLSGTVELSDSWVAIAPAAGSGMVEYFLLDRRPASVKAVADVDGDIVSVEFQLPPGGRIYAGSFHYGLVTRDTDADGTPDFLDADAACSVPTLCKKFCLKKWA